jgi:hypothetical protein
LFVGVKNHNFRTGLSAGGVFDLFSKKSWKTFFVLIFAKIFISNFVALTINLFSIVIGSLEYQHYLIDCIP